VLYAEHEGELLKRIVVGGGLPPGKMRGRTLPVQWNEGRRQLRPPKHRIKEGMGLMRDRINEPAGGGSKAGARE